MDLDNPTDQHALKLLANKCPEATSEELERFYIAKGKKYDLAMKQLCAYITWRRESGLLDLEEKEAKAEDDDDDVKETNEGSIEEKSSNSISPIVEKEVSDEDDWNMAAAAAIKICKEDPSKNPSNTLPRLARFDCVDGTKSMIAHDGKKVLQFIPAQMDVDLASDVCYATTIAFYLDRKLERTSFEKVIVSVDVRAGKGWKNPPAGSIVPFIKKTISILEQNFPERLAKSIVYPMPFVATALWKIIKAFLDANTANKISILGGPALEDSPLPKDKLEKYIPTEELDRMELNRESSFLQSMSVPVPIYGAKA